MFRGSKGEKRIGKKKKKGKRNGNGKKKTETKKKFWKWNLDELLADERQKISEY